MTNFAHIVDIKPLFSGSAASRKTAIQGLGNAIEKDGVFVAAGLPDGWHRERRAAALLAFFGLSDADKLCLATRRVRADSPRSYRGYVSTLKDGWAYNEFFDIGPERVLAKPALQAAQIFTETNVWPAWPPFPNWRAEILAYHGAMEKTGTSILSAAGEYLGLPQGKIAALFANAGSTLRLLNYPRKPDGAAIKEEMPLEDGTRLVTGRHIDACAFSLLWQGQAGLQAETPGGRWLDIPHQPDCVSVHVGSVMEFLTAGRWRATPHRVLDSGAARGAIGYFHEPNLDAELSPLIVTPAVQAPGTAGLTYGGHLLERFARYEGLEDLAASAAS
ncbi:MAG: hypothetical protein O3A94_09280 [Proteobacteria bacterium]|nr:hypothetical protein [Pseudomonadota bacterium]